MAVVFLALLVAVVCYIRVLQQKIRHLQYSAHQISMLNSATELVQDVDPLKIKCSPFSQRSIDAVEKLLKSKAKEISEDEDWDREFGFAEQLQPINHQNVESWDDGDLEVGDSGFSFFSPEPDWDDKEGDKDCTSAAFHVVNAPEMGVPLRYKADLPPPTKSEENSEHESWDDVDIGELNLKISSKVHNAFIEEDDGEEDWDAEIEAEELASDKPIKPSYPPMSLEAQKSLMFMSRQMATGVWRFCLSHQSHPLALNLLAVIFILGYEDADPSLMAWSRKCIGWDEGFRMDIGHPRQLLDFLSLVKDHLDQELQKFPDSEVKASLLWIGSHEYLHSKNII